MEMLHAQAAHLYHDILELYLDAILVSPMKPQKKDAMKLFPEALQILEQTSS